MKLGGIIVSIVIALLLVMIRKGLGFGGIVGLGCIIGIGVLIVVNATKPKK